MSVLRVDHQKNYVVISKEALEDPNLSFKAKGLWAYCMSRPNDWEFHVSHLATVSKDGEDSIYSAIKELVREGYCDKVQGKLNGRYTSVDYVVREIKIIFTLRDFPLTEKQRTEIPPLLSNDSHQVMKENNIPPAKGEVSFESLEISKELWNEVLKIHPKHKPPKLEDWARTIDKCLKIDQRSLDDIRAVLKFSFEKSPFWAKTLRSAEGLRKHFDTIWMQMTPVNNSGTRREKNLEIAHKIKNSLSQSGESHLLIIHKSSVSRQSGDSISMDLPPETFEEILINWFQLRKK